MPGNRRYRFLDRRDRHRPLVRPNHTRARVPLLVSHRAQTSRAAGCRDDGGAHDVPGGVTNRGIWAQRSMCSCASVPARPRSRVDSISSCNTATQIKAAISPLVTGRPGVVFWGAVGEDGASRGVIPMSFKVIDGDGPGKEERDSERQREWAKDEFFGAIRELAANILRVVRGAGKAY